MACIVESGILYLNKKPTSEYARDHNFELTTNES